MCFFQMQMTNSTSFMIWLLLLIKIFTMDVLNVARECGTLLTVLCGLKIKIFAWKYLYCINKSDTSYLLKCFFN